MSTERRITIMNEDDLKEDCYVRDYDELKLEDCLTGEQMGMVNQYSDPVFYCISDGDYKDDTDEEGYENGNIFTLESPLKDIFANSIDSTPTLVVGYKIKAHISYDDVSYKILATSGTQLSNLLECIVPNVGACTFTGSTYGSTISSKLKDLENENNEVYIEILK
ncbi:hypothetical protein BX667DRAFT_503202 [Coemansia mojavensis]|nr:hypothetical protein BX667DRAFT_503202 [Coemansia mojavensis]